MRFLGCSTYFRSWNITSVFSTAVPDSRCVRERAKRRVADNLQIFPALKSESHFELSTHQEARTNIIMKKIILHGAVLIASSIAAIAQTPKMSEAQTA